MPSPLPALAQSLETNERALRRAVVRGTVRARRLGPRRLAIGASERAYLRTNWPLLAALLRTLRTEPNVRLAVLYGSAARGDDHAGSDVDLLVAFRNDTPAAAGTLVVRLERALGREVDVARLAPVSANAPLLLLDALDEGRVLIDRDDLWHELTQRRAAIAKAAKQSLKTIEAAATASLAELLAEAEQGDRELAED